MKKESIKVVVKPGASSTEVIGLYDDMIKIKVCAPPEKGKANKELICFLSKELEIPKSSISVSHGEFSNIKIIDINGVSKKSITERLLKLNRP
jgi:uncharacterized protein (TIGR00251 family)